MSSLVSVGWASSDGVVGVLDLEAVLLLPAVEVLLDEQFRAEAFLEGTARVTSPVGEAFVGGRHGEPSRDAAPGCGL
jgi:hypothetical protein